ncbi:MAG TPA: zinc-ribbon domain-containing protein [Candidatus Polarisedimenticolia bacterium]|nr:zinc-ribbon domain-containing protein [Candidatus Polarisedimenticolia bacterium]
MNLECPGCRARYRLDDAKVPGETARLSCPKCRAVFIARKSSPSGPARMPQGAPKTPATTLTALLADEPREFRDFTAGLLREGGFEVGITDNGEEALLLAGSHRFDLILLSVYLRRLLGINVCERLKSDPDLRSTPVILIGAMARQEPGGLPRGLYGADDIIPTSLGPGEMKRKIREWVPAACFAEEPGPAALSPVVAVHSAASPASAEEMEIRRLARIMVSDIQMYHPEKFSRALREGTFFESFGEELGKGREIVDQRFARVANRAQLMASALRDTLEEIRPDPVHRRASAS